jgi:hypothetical protein
MKEIVETHSHIQIYHGKHDNDLNLIAACESQPLFLPFLLPSTLTSSFSFVTTLSVSLPAPPT